MNLRDITKEFQEFNSMDWDEKSEVYLTTLATLEMSLQEKGKNIVSLLQNWQSNENELSNEIKRLQAKKKTLANQQAQLKQWLTDNMIDSGIDKIECPLFTITLRKAVKDNVLVIDDVESLLKHYTKPVAPVIDKATLKADLKGGAVVKGAHLEDSKRGLLIK